MEGDSPKGLCRGAGDGVWRDYELTAAGRQHLYLELPFSIPFQTLYASQSADTILAPSTHWSLGGIAWHDLFKLQILLKNSVSTFKNVHSAL